MYLHYNGEWRVDTLATCGDGISVDAAYAQGMNEAVVETVWLTQANLDALREHPDPSVADWLLG